MSETGNSHHDAAIEWLNTSAVQEAEDMTGMTLYEDPAVAGIAIMLMPEIASRRRAILGELGDTYWNMSWSSFEESLMGTDFEIVTQPLNTDPEKLKHKNIIAADRERKLLLIASSYSFVGETEKLSHVKVYGTIDGGDDEAGQHKAASALWKNQMSFRPVGETHFQFNFDGREGLVTKLRQLDESEVNFTDWVNEYSPIFNLIYFKNADKATWQACEIKAFLELPDWVREFMNQDVQNLWFNGPIKLGK